MELKLGSNTASMRPERALVGRVARVRAAAILLALLLALPAAARDVTGRFSLRNHDGAMVSERAYDGKVRVVTFGYTFCPDICPTTLSTIAAALDLLGPDAPQVAPLFITVDPRRDTALHLKDYLQSFGPSFVGLTGTREMVADAAFQFGARYRIHRPTNASDPATYFIDHTAALYVMDRQGGYIATLGHAVAPAALADQLRAALTR